MSIVAQTGAGPLASLGPGTRLMLALGAGLCEELLFRVLLVGGLAAGLRWLLGGQRTAAGMVSALAGALIFSAFHYIGEYGDKFEVASFTYRAIAGLVFSALYLTRGFGITAWTHALYDVYVMVV
ncbi:MAG TPA: CPBP family intramembrane glutamic endopeptidase [Gemmatimonadaceae bacterium]